jgi:hypothetical protein
MLLRFKMNKNPFDVGNFGFYLLLDFETIPCARLSRLFLKSVDGIESHPTPASFPSDKVEYREFERF